MSHVKGARPPLILILAIFLLVAILQLPASLIVGNISVMGGILINQIVFILLLPLLIVRLFGYSPFQLIKPHKINGMQLLVSACLTLGAAVLLSYLKSFTTDFIPIGENLKRAYDQTMAIHSWSDMFPKLILIGVIAPICEEILFRGLIQNSLAHRFGNVRAVLLTSIFFAMLHAGSFQPVLYLLLGLLFAWIYAVTGSIRITILCHATNNAWILAHRAQDMSFPLETPFGQTDTSLIASAFILAMTSLVWLGRPRTT